MSAPPAERRETCWHRLPTVEVAHLLDVEPQAGLSAEEARRRLAKHGPNAIREQGRRGPLQALIGQFTDVTILLLIGAAIVSGLVGDLRDTLVILGIVVLNAGIGFAQEFRAERAVAALRQMAASAAVVLRGGQRRSIPAADLVPGDEIGRAHV